MTAAAPGLPDGPMTLAADIGSTRVKVGLVSADGVVLDHVALPAPQAQDTSARGMSGGVDLEAQAWWRTFTDGVEQLAARHPAAVARIATIALGGMTRTQVLLDAGGMPVGPAIGLADTRATPIVPGLLARLPAGHPETVQINAFHPLARLAWLAAAAPERLAQVAAVVEPKDFVVARLTGRIVSDDISLARLVAAARVDAGGTSLLTAAGLPAHIVPPRLAPGDVVGRVRSGLAGIWARLAGTPVLCGCHDTWMAVLGMGAMRPGFAYLISGTTEVLGAIAAEPATAEGLMTVDWGGLAQVGGPSLAGADTLAWIAGLLFAAHRAKAGSAAPDPATDGLGELLAAPRHGHPALFLPFLRGERVPYWDPQLRGAFLGLAREHGAADLAWAVVEGLTCLNRVVLARAEAATGLRVSEVRLGGGGVRLDRIVQAKADILDRPVIMAATDEPGLAGAGLLAAASRAPGGATPAALAAVQEGLPTGRAFLPDPRRRAEAQALFDLFQDAHAAMVPLSRRLVGMARVP